MSKELDRIKNLLSNLEEEPLLKLVEEQLATNVNPMSIVEACRDGMGIVGERFAQNDYFVTDLIFSAELFNSVMIIVNPRLQAANSNEHRTKVVFGTVLGDIHDIGKNIVVTMLRCSGFEVYDVGIDKPPEVFVDKVLETGATIVGLSGLLTVAYPSMEATIKALSGSGIRDRVKVMIGGGLVDEFVRATVGADAWGRDAMEAVKLAKSFSGGQMK